MMSSVLNHLTNIKRSFLILTIYCIFSIDQDLPYGILEQFNWQNKVTIYLCVPIPIKSLFSHLVSQSIFRNTSAQNKALKCNFLVLNSSWLAWFYHWMAALVTSLMKGIGNSRPPTPQYNFIWDIEQFLKGTIKIPMMHFEIKTNLKANKSSVPEFHTAWSRWLLWRKDKLEQLCS